ncbi:hypothetical protein OG568_22335 [Streptomyces sp. NBC_01450]|uniref:hypothetical protein n=1 Tax=Streptomyces sp. NBC_01450 TaxID=2903871 RepID=UPI002E332975|nr:hypothetical protein [Streptomyces sp. NBC_01450]
MQTPEQQYAAHQAQRPASSSRSAVSPASHSEWRQMTAHQQAAHLARLDGREDEAREWERMGAQAAAADAAAEARPKKRGWFR